MISLDAAYLFFSKLKIAARVIYFENQINILKNLYTYSNSNTLFHSILLILY